MVEVATSTLVAGGVGVGVLVLVLVVLLVRSHRRAAPVANRVASVAARLEEPGGGGDADGHGDEHDAVSRLERLAQGAVLRVNDAEDIVSRLTGALDGLTSGIIVGDDQGDVVYRNAMAEGLDRNEEIVHEALEEMLAAGVRGERRSRVLELLGPPRRSLAVAGRPLDDGRRLVGVVVTIDDVSERRRLDAMRRDFVTNLTAELKTPVAALGLLAGTIVREDDPGLTRRLAERLSWDSLRVGRLIDDLVELSRLDAQLLPVHEPVPVHLLVAQAVEEIRALALHRNISVDASEAPTSLTVVGDRRQLVSGLRHLVENAVSFSDAGAQVRIKVALAGDDVEVSVRDEGPGIPARELDRIFECFYRVGAGRGRDSAGTGLGLAIASQVAAAHGGEVTVESEEGKGSTFRLVLPAGPAAHRAPARQAG